MPPSNQTPQAASNYQRRVASYTMERVAQDAPTNVIQKFEHLGQVVRGREPRENAGLQNQIDFARLSKASYAPDVPARQVEGFDIVPDLTTDDRTVYQHRDTGKVVIAFRGTDPKSWGRKGDAKSFFHSRGFRDVTSDLLLGAGEQGLSHRFKNAERVTKTAIDRYGHENVIVTGHSLGGSQAMWVSNKFGVHAEVYNPHIDWEAAMSRANYYNTALHTNVTDPVAAFAGSVDWQSRDVRYNRKAAPFLGQHGIENFIRPPKLVPKPEPKLKSNGIRTFMNRPEGSIPMPQAPKREYKHGGNCSTMPLYLQIQYGCRQIPVR